MRRIFIILNILMIVFVGIPFPKISKAQQAGASIYLSPSTGTFHLGSTFDVSIFVNTGGNDVNTMKINLKFDPQKIQVASPVGGKSIISVWVSQPSYSNIDGILTFQGGVPTPGFNTSSGLISTITFRAITPGLVAISVQDSSNVLLNDGKGTDILSSTGRGLYDIVMPPPEGPKVFSSSHPDQNKWYKDNNPIIQWEQEGSATDFSYSIDKDFRGFPDNISEGLGHSVSYTDLEDGIWYFHIKAKKGEVWGGVTHFITNIDTTPPAVFGLELETSLASIISTGNPIISFITTDALSGIDHYELKNINLSAIKEIEHVDFFVEVISPFRLSLDGGTYNTIVRAFDKAGNWRDSSEKIRVFPKGKFIITKEGVNLWFFFLSWQRLILIILILIIIAAAVIFWGRKYHLKIYLERGRIKETQKKADAHRDNIKKKYIEADRNL